MKHSHVHTLTTKFILLVLLLSGFFLQSLYAQEQTGIEGRVVDTETDQPLQGVTVLIQDTELAAATDGEGFYQVLNIPPGTYVVEARMIGFQPHRRTVTILEGSVITEDFGLISEEYEMEEIAVEAEIIDRLREPFSRARIGRKDIERLSSVTTADLLEEIPGVVTQRVGGWGDKPYMEGMTDSRILVRFDGAKTNQACPMGMDACTATIEPDMIDNIDVQRGPGSARYGSGALGGVINVTSRTADYATGEQFRSSAELVTRYRSVSNSRVSSLKLSGGNRTFDVLLGAGGGLHDDYRTPGGTVETSGFDSGYLHLNTRYRPADDHHLMFMTNIYRARDIGWPTANTMIPAEKRDVYVLNYTGYRLLEGLRELSVNLSSQPMHHDMKNFLGDGTVWHGISNTSTYSGDIETVWAPARNHELAAGVNLSNWGMSGKREDSESSEGLVSILPNSALIETGLYLEDEFRITDPFTLTAGLRYNHIRSNAESDPSIPIQADELGSQEQVITGSFAMLYRLTDSQTLTGSIARGFKAATPVERYVSAPMLDGYYHTGDPVLNSETNLSTRLGYRGMKNWIRWDLEVFYNRLSNFITPEIDPNADIPFDLKGVQRFTNIGEAVILGGSGSVSVVFTPSLVLNTGITYNRGENLRTGEPLPRMSPLRFDTSLLYEFSDDFSLTAAMNAATAQNRYAGDAGEIRSPGYAGFDLRGEWDLSDQISLSAGVDNVLNTSYRDHLNLAQLPEPGRNAYVTVSLNLPVTGQKKKRSIDPGRVFTQTLNIEGMACEFCVQTIRDRLSRTEGVASTDISLSDNKAEISFVPERISIPDLIRIINQLGYKASLPRPGGDEPMKD